MKYLITESKLKQTLFKYYDSIFEDWYFVENGDWEGVSVPKYNGELLIGYKKDDPNILNSPYQAVNHFLKVFENKYKLLSITYRVFLEKI